MKLLVTYDVATDTPEGRARLRRVAQVCKNYGQRVQKSVFECSVDDAQRLVLRHRLLKILNREEDSLRIYRLAEGHPDWIENYGISHPTDFDGPLVI